MQLEAIEQAFGVQLPTLLRERWGLVLQGGSNPLRLLNPTRGIEDLTETAKFVEREQRAVGGLRSTAEPFSVLPFAHGSHDSDYVVLLLGEPDGGRGFCIAEYPHGCIDAERRFTSFFEWITREEPIRAARVALEEAARNDLDSYEALRDEADSRPHVFDRWCRDVLASRGLMPATDAILAEALEHFWECGSPY